MQRLDVSGAVRPIYGSLGVKRLIDAQHKLLMEAEKGDIFNNVRKPV